ncbi:hypothetical protein GOV10_02865 [Candidatus Woesearchaeota archaeon]|nr:hypothetical protein [Candidatus Woesearchaeota archaeon]
MTSPYTFNKRIMTGSMSNVFDLNGPDGRVILKVATAHNAKREWKNLKRLKRVHNVPEPIAYFGDSSLEDKLGIKLNIFGGYTTAFMMEYVPNAAHLLGNKQDYTFFRHVKDIAENVFEHNLGLTSDARNPTNMLVSYGQPWMIDWCFANCLPRKKKERKECLGGHYYLLFELESRHTISEKRVFTNPFPRVRIF